MEILGWGRRKNNVHVDIEGFVEQIVSVIGQLFQFVRFMKKEMVAIT